MIEPALTPEEWAGGYAAPNPSLRFYSHERGVQLVQNTQAVEVPDVARHALAALCLHGQPFGFTHEIQEAVRKAAAIFDDEYGYSPRHQEQIALVHKAADLIAALLPPRKP